MKNANNQKTVQIEVTVKKLEAYPNIWIDELTAVLYLESEEGKMKKIEAIKSSNYKNRVVTS